MEGFKCEDPGKELARGTADSSVVTTKFSSGLDAVKQESSSSGTGGLSSVPLKVYS